MNKKSRIQQVILINWKGMFYQPFELDEGMTILEGANGTGKTTIMIAAYTCLMPDLNFLNFQNVTTVGARKNEDKGLYGRLGKGDPVFSLLDIMTTNGERHLMGVQLQKKTYPQVHLKHFAVRNIDPHADLDQILLLQHTETNEQEIPDLAEIGKRASMVGGELIHFRHAKDYFRFMFDAGITPARMAENEERKQFNQLLHTSLYGGLSRSLQSSLRDYLLPQDNTLLSSIQDMEQNLLTCRRTRATIQRYQSVRNVIQGVYQTGLEMFSSAFFANRLAEEQMLQKALKIRNERRSYRMQWDSLAAEIIETRTGMFKQEEIFQHALADKEVAKEHLATARSAHSTAQEIDAKQAERDKQQKIARVERERFLELKQQEKENRALNQELTNRQLELAHKLSNAGEAWETLSKQVGLYQQARNLLSETRELLENDDISAENIEDWMSSARQQFAEAQTAHQTAYQQWQDINLKQQHRIRYMELLAVITGTEIQLQTAGELARQTCADFRELEERQRQTEGIPAQLEVLEEKISRRNEVQSNLSAAELDSVRSTDDLDRAWQELVSEIKISEEKQLTQQRSIREKRDALESIDRQLPAVKQKLAAWESFQETRQQLETLTTKTIATKKELSYLRKFLDDQQLKLNLERYRLEADLKQKQLLFNTLVSTGVADERLEALKEEGYGSLLSNRYEDIPLEWSANLESRLGPLTNALVVKDVQAAAEDLAKNFNRPDEIWLVEEDKKEKLPESRELLDSILVNHGDIWRLSRLPEHPQLGKLARTEKVKFLRDEIKKMTDELEKIQQRIKGAKENLTLLAQLVPVDGFLEETSPLEALESLEKSRPELEDALQELNNQSERLGKKLASLLERRNLVQQTFAHKDLLRETELEKTRAELRRELDRSEAHQTEIDRKRELVEELQQGLSILSQPADSDISQLESALQQARQEEDRLRHSLEALQRLSESKHHFQYADQVPLLEEKKGFNQHLNDQLAEIDGEQKALELKYAEISVKLGQAEESSYGEEKKLTTFDGQLEQLRENLEKLSFDGSEASVSQAEETVAAVDTTRITEEKRLNETKTAGFRLEAEIKQAQENKTRAEVAWKRIYAQSRPVLSAWQQFRNQARAEGKLARLLAAYHAELQTGSKKPDRFWRQESATRSTLLRTLESMNNTRVLLDTIKANRAEESDETSQGNECLFIWQQIRGYLNQVIPVDLQTNDPEKAQATIAEKLDTLEQNLEQQERSLRQHVQNIPSHIHAKIRKEKSRIRQLNQKLESVRFGFLQTIRINIETQPKLKAFLDVLPQQLDFFTEAGSEDVPVETLMANLYEEIGAGKVKGDLLLDYRHYVRLNIEVKREGNEEFEKVTSTNLSTGESIGVGIAVLIMVLMSWEDQANLLRNTEESGSLRFLLLDESSRLDQKALYTLNDFCTNMELQLLIAAPSVEKTLRGTTHHLTRGYYDGREEVIVRGRRLN